MSMKRNLKTIWIGTTITLLFFIILFQLLRMDVLNRIFTVQEKPQKKVSVMTSSKAGAGEQLMVTILAKPEDAANDLILKNITYAFTYAKVPFTFKRPEELRQIKPSPYHVIVTTTEAANQWPYDAIRSFVEQGGRLYIANRFFDPKWNDLTGIQENNGFFKEDMYGLSIEKPYFPGYKTVVDKNGAMPNSMMNVVLKENAQVYIKAEGVPMLWTYAYGKGKVVYWNATFLSTKMTRGLITQALGLAVPKLVTAQAAVKVMFIDDFPAPIPSGNTAAIHRDYDMSTKAFFETVWWDNMKSIAKTQKLLYTTGFIGTYRNDTSLRASDLIKNSRDQMVRFGRESLHMGDELGFHGYNHQPLVTKEEPIDPGLGYTPWQSQQQMEYAIAQARALFSHYFPKQTIRTYVPPSNILRETGLRALMKELPSLKTIASVYDGAGLPGVFEQEFGLDDNDLFHLPRISSGYGQLPEMEFVITDAIANFGVFSHFIHPDDVLDESRSGGEGWREMRKGFDDLMTRVNKTYPYLKPYTASEAREKLMRYNESRLDVYYGENEIAISGKQIVNPSDIFIRVEQGRQLDTGSFDGYTVRKLGTVYAVAFTKPFLTIRVKDVK